MPCLQVDRQFPRLRSRVEVERQVEADAQVSRAAPICPLACRSRGRRNESDSSADLRACLTGAWLCRALAAAHCEASERASGTRGSHGGRCLRRPHVSSLAEAAAEGGRRGAHTGSASESLELRAFGGGAWRKRHLADRLRDEATPVVVRLTARAARHGTLIVLLCGPIAASTHFLLRGDSHRATVRCVCVCVCQTLAPMVVLRRVGGIALGAVGTSAPCLFSRSARRGPMRAS